MSIQLNAKFYTDKVQYGVNSIFAEVQAGVRAMALSLRKSMLANTPIDTGLAKMSWTRVSFSGVGTDRYEARFGNPVWYTIILEEGLYNVLGRKTVKTPRGIFSAQAPEGIMQPILEDDQYINELLDTAMEDPNRAAQMTSSIRRREVSILGEDFIMRQTGKMEWGTEFLGGKLYSTSFGLKNRVKIGRK